MAVAVVAALMTACGGDDDTPDGGSADSSTSNTTAAATPTSAASDDTSATPPTDTADSAGTSSTASSDTSATTEPAAPTGNPFKVGLIYTAGSPIFKSEQLLTTAEVAAEFFNENGGFGGHPVEIVGCNDQGDPNQAGVCAEELIDAEVSAVISSSLFDAAIAPATTGAGIPHFPTIANSPPTQDGAGVYNVAMGVTQIVGVGVMANSAGLDTVDILVAETGTSAELIALVKCGLAPEGVAAGAELIVPFTTADYAPTVQEMGQGETQGAAVIFGPTQMTPFGAAISQFGNDTTLMGAGGTFTSAVVADTGGSDSPYQGSLVFSPFPSLADPGWGDFQATINERAADEAGEILNDQTSQAGWVALRAMKSVIDESLAGVDITAAAFKTALDASDAVDTGGLTPPLDFTAELASPYSRLVNRTIYFTKIEGDAFVSVDGDTPHDLSDVLDGC